MEQSFENHQLETESVVANKKEEEVKINSLDQIRDLFQSLNSNYKLRETESEKWGRVIEITFDITDSEDNEIITNRVTFFQIDDRFFYKFGENTLPEDCEEIIEKIEKTNIELYF